MEGSYREIHGDLLDLFGKGMFDGMGHGANCFCRMRSGIAGQIAQIFPGAVEADNETEVGDRSKMGSYTNWEHPNGSVLYNLYTQYNYGREPNHLYLNYAALEEALRRMRENLSWKLKRQLEVGFPQIGCGLAQGDWEKVSGIIRRVYDAHHVTIVIYNG